MVQMSEWLQGGALLCQVWSYCLWVVDLNCCCNCIILRLFGAAFGPAAFLLHLFTPIAGEFGKPVSEVCTGFLKACVNKARRWQWGGMSLFFFPPPHLGKMKKV